jgi:hypothetical protein
MPRYGRTGRAPLTPPADLVGHRVSWRPKSATTGQRYPAQYGRVDGFDPAAKTLSITVQQPTSAWQTNPERTVVVPLSSGPFTIVD